jgi:hypothetical protein
MAVFVARKRLEVMLILVTGHGVPPSVREKRKMKFGDKNMWFGGESVVGRKGDDGEWTEVRCSVM